IINYKKRQQIMSSEVIRTKWNNFVKTHEDIFLSNKEGSCKMLNTVKQYIDTYKRKPSSVSKNQTIKKMGLWIIVQRRNYKKGIKSMKNINRRQQWESFVNDYK